MKLQTGKKCRIYGEMDNVRIVRVNGDNVIVRVNGDNVIVRGKNGDNVIVRVNGDNVIVRGKNGQCKAVSAKNLRTPISEKFRWLAGVIDFLTVKI